MRSCTSIPARPGAIALAAVVPGEETRIRRLEPDAVELLLACVGALIAIASESTKRDARHPAHEEGVIRSADAPADSWKMVSRRLK